MTADAGTGSPHETPGPATIPADPREIDPYSAGPPETEAAAAGPAAGLWGAPWLVALVPALAWVALLAPIPGTVLPLAWPASGVLAGLLLGADAPLRRTLLAVGVVGIALAHLAHGTDPGLAVSFALACAAEAAVVRWLLARSRGEQRPTLLDDGDVSRMISAVALGSVTAGGGYALALLAGGEGPALLGGLAVAATHAAALMVLLPLFLRTPTFPPVAPRGERVTQWVIGLGTTAIVGALADAPPLLFVVMPMFAWLGFRGTLREATWVLAGVLTLTTTLTALGVGPVAGLGARYDLPAELVACYLQLFLMDCGLILLPLSVSVALHRNAAAEAAAGRDTLERLLASATATAIFSTDAAGRIVVFNPGAEAMLGYAADEVIGDPPDRFHPPDELRRLADELGTRPVFTRICAALTRSAEPRRLWTFRRKDGSTGTMLMTAAPLSGGPRGGGGLMCTAEDVTERERAQAALVATLEHREAAMARLEELDRIRSDFVSTVSHELRTPITSIIGYTEMMLDPDTEPLPMQHQKALERVTRNSRRLLGLIEDLLTATQVQTSELTATKEPLDLRDPVTGAVDAASDVVAGRDLRLHVALPPDPVAFVGDPAQLERLVLNLLTNAIKFTRDGGSVGVCLTATGTGIEVVVRDSGVGIPDDEQDQLFSRFFRSSTASELAIQGTGLGLTIVQAIAGLHGGEVGIASVAGQGTTVTVSLPPSEAAGHVPDP